MDEARRRPVLTDRILTEALPAMVAVADSEIDYLQSRLTDTGAGAIADALKPGMEARLEQLKRAREWIAGMVEAVQGKRAKAV